MKKRIKKCLRLFLAGILLIPCFVFLYFHFKQNNILVSDDESQTNFLNVPENTYTIWYMLKKQIVIKKMVLMNNEIPENELVVYREQLISAKKQLEQIENKYPFLKNVELFTPSTEYEKSNYIKLKKEFETCTNNDVKKKLKFQINHMKKIFPDIEN